MCIILFLGMNSYLIFVGWQEKYVYVIYHILILLLLFAYFNLLA